MSLEKFQLIQRRIIDKGAVQSPIVVGSLQSTEDLPFGIKACSQVGVVLCDDADQDALAAFADGVAYELDVTFYRLKDVSAGAVVGNILFEESSKVVVHKVDGELYINNATSGAFNPNAFIVNVFTDNVGFTAAGLTSFC